MNGERTNEHKQYLGDGVYVDTRGYQLVLTTNDGLRDTNTIYLEPEVYKALARYVQQWIADESKAVGEQM